MEKTTCSFKREALFEQHSVDNTRTVSAHLRGHSREHFSETRKVCSFAIREAILLFRADEFAVFSHTLESSPG